MLNLGGQDNIILGHPWLTRNNTQIDWGTGQVHMIRTPISRHDKPEVVEQRYLMRYLGACQQENLKYTAAICQQQKKMERYRREFGEGHPYIQKLTLSTALAQAVEKVKQKLPPQYSWYAKVFDEPKAGKLPPQQPFNHAIELKDTFIPKVSKTYLPNPKEMDACKEFIDKHLRSGKICKSQSPQASPFFFIQKKDRGLHPCQDYQYLNKHMVKNTYLLPLISTLISKLKGAKSFSKMDV